MDEIVAKRFQIAQDLINTAALIGGLTEKADMLTSYINSTTDLGDADGSMDEVVKRVVALRSDPLLDSTLRHLMNDASALIISLIGEVEASELHAWSVILDNLFAKYDT